jgi:hypothetical protein
MLLNYKDAQKTRIVKVKTRYDLSRSTERCCRTPISANRIRSATCDYDSAKQMNIFFLHPNPRKCARWHCDKHVVKMILESCQMLYTCHWICSQDCPPMIHCAPNGGYKPTHRKHPCNLWLLESLDNYIWLVNLTYELLLEYKFRYGNKHHKCEEHFQWLSTVYPLDLQSRGLTPPRCAMPDEFKISKNPVTCYRLFYKKSKDQQRKIVSYTARHRPHFLDD